MTLTLTPTDLDLDITNLDTALTDLEIGTTDLDLLFLPCMSCRAPAWHRGVPGGNPAPGEAVQRSRGEAPVFRGTTGHPEAAPVLTPQGWCVLVCVFNAINGSAAYLSELLHVYTPSLTLRSSSDARVLKIHEYKRKTRDFSTVSCFGPHIWNSLPQDLTHWSTLSSFKAKQKTFLFSQYFRPN